jgi:hypothetical protein
MPSAIDEDFLRRLSHTPMRDLLRGRVTGRLDIRGRLAATNLPVEIRSLIQRVVFKTRLWWLEKADLANEMIAHFSDGIESGATTEQLIESFGNERMAIKLIRRAKRRNRPLIWHVYRTIVRAIVGLIVIYLAIAMYFYMGRPFPSVNYIALINRPTEQVPQGQHAWPLYRQAMLASGVRPESDQEKKWWDMLYVRDNAPQPQELVNWLDSHRNVIDLIHQASEKPIMGFVVGSQGSAYDPEIFPHPAGVAWSVSNEALISVLLPHLNPLRSLADVIKDDAVLARNRGNTAQFLQDITTLQNMGRQLHGDFLIGDLVAMGIRNQALNQIELTLVQAPNLLSDSTIQNLAHELAGPNSDADLISLHNERMFFYDLVQRIYTDDGHGNGRLTPAGIEFMKSLPVGKSREPPIESLFSKLAGPMAMLIISRREDLQQTYDAVLDSAEASLHRPLREADWLGYQRRLDQMRASLVESIHYALVLMIAPAMERPQVAAERYLGHRDGVLIALALEMYRRQHGEYPKSLDELTPMLLPRVPVDRITGEAVRYRIVDDKPLIYSVGADRKDDAGRAAKFAGHSHAYTAAEWNLQKNRPIPDGDWILYPQSKFELDGE